ncbi:MAG: YajQ family cyclic di-GMP-binding protein [SAR202 cluster bacterium]|nr:YajQ family cyclic di-GMP-binding protein [Chloroflexota bacterium]MQG22754.1 YajQ family cyclic di-GMP-binding protein [SAR202 cluster bacterium]|tara:strand:+ start:2555 stop:3040 length:486 start_codon:yes stop_codon:yes gene_type:complete
MPSFDVVSRTDVMEVDNAVNGVKREIKQRYDLAGTKCDIQRTDNSLTITADDNMKLEQVESLLFKYFSQRKLEKSALDFQDVQSASGDALRRLVEIKQGIDMELAKKITKEVKSIKMKVQISIKGNELHVSGKKRDDLQKVIEFIKNMKNVQPLQYVNFRD